MTLKVYPDLIQGSDDWLQARLGLLTASEMKLIMTATLKVADNDKSRAHLYELAAQRITDYVEPHYVSDDMLRGHSDEQLAVYTYSEKIAQVTQIGFMVRDFGAFKIGYSPDGLVGDDGLIEVKSRRQKYQVQTIVDYLPGGEIMPEYVLQAQTGLLVSGRKWLDHITYCGGLPMAIVRVYPDPELHAAIMNAAAMFEAKLAEKLAVYRQFETRLIPTERVIEQEMIIQEIHTW